MACFKPLKGYVGRWVNPATGKRPVVFSPHKGFVDRPVSVPCGQCVGCRLRYSREWAVRCIHEASEYDYNCFITLTYSDEYLPEGRTLVLEDYQKFMKRLRKHMWKYHSIKLKYFHCGEYGSRFGRPHYHALLFNMDFRDKRLHQVKNGVSLYTSAHLQELWPFGFSTIGDVTFESAAYVARYCIKKITGDGAKEHYEWIDPETGEIFDRVPEYTSMSNGLGERWIKRYSEEVWNSDRIVINGRQVTVPRYYDRIMEVEDQERFRAVRAARMIKAREKAEDNTPRRLADREKVTLAKVSRLKRSLDDDV